MNKNWFTLYGDTFLWIKDSIGFVYNASNKKRIRFLLSDQMKEICQHLLEPQNLYTIELTEDRRCNEEIYHWFLLLKEMEAGYFSYNLPFEERPVSLMPILKVQDDRMYYKAQQALGFQGKILQNLHELIFYLNGSEYGNNEYFKQTFYPIKTHQFLDRTSVLSFIENSRNLFLGKINLVGNIFLYPEFDVLIRSISDMSIPVTVYVLVTDFLEHLQELERMKLPMGVELNLLVDTHFDISILDNISLPISFTFLVFSEMDFVLYSNQLEKRTEKLNVSFVPLYNGNNLSFFETNVFMEEADIDKMELSKSDIFIRQAMNIENFGRLVVMPDKKVYANVNMPPLGVIEDSPYTIVYREFMDGKSWFDLRNHEPCDKCIYQWLCPSPSNYEIVIKRSNLCHVKIESLSD